MKLDVVLRAIRLHANEVATSVALALAVFFASAALRGLQGEPAADAAPNRIEAAAIPLPLVRSAAKPAPIVPTAPPLELSEGELARRETLGPALRKQGFSGVAVHEIVQAMSPVFNFRYAKAGDDYRAYRDHTGRLVRFEYERSPVEKYSLERQGEKLVPTKHEPEVIVQRATIAGTVTTSLYEAVMDLGESGQLAHDFAEIFAWDVDFSKAHAGDEFRAVYERRFFDTSAGPTYLGPGRILAARFANSDGDFTAVYFEPSKGHGGYYRPDGSAAQRQFLQAPLNYRRISSQYSSSRLHPVLKVRRPHLGVDYAAAHGTPVWSVADGVVIFRGRSGGLGNTVKVRHRSGHISYYGHLAGFARGLNVGDRVRQKEVIGFVGSTGLSTGPHLHFVLEQNGKLVNPATVRMPQGEPISKERMVEFARVRNDVLGVMDPTPLRIPTHEAL
jgi:murein DD-endopeptidase MepM/ murein hydrolase activator NlpD